MPHVRPLAIENIDVSFGIDTVGGEFHVHILLDVDNLKKSCGLKLLILSKLSIILFHLAQYWVLKHLHYLEQLLNYSIVMQV